MKTTIGKLIEVRTYCELYSGMKLTKFVYACKKNLDKLNEALKEHDVLMADKRIELCVLGENKEVLQDEKGGYRFTPENLKKLNEFYRNELSKEIQYEGYIATDFSDIKEDINALEALNGFVIDVNIEELIS